MFKADRINPYKCSGRVKRNGRYVRFGSKADMCGAATHVCFTSDSDHESGHVPIVMSALPPKADMCSALADVRFGPIADIASVTRSHRRRGRAIYLE
jgi:hypothetical protein